MERAFDVWGGQGGLDGPSIAAVLLDEAGMTPPGLSSSISCLAGLDAASLILVGDPAQLPAPVRSTYAKLMGAELATSLLDVPELFRLMSFLCCLLVCFYCVVALLFGFLRFGLKSA